VLRDAAQALRSLEAKQATRCTCPDPKPAGWPLAHAHNCPRVAPKEPTYYVPPDRLAHLNAVMDMDP
jgi:hypothetical protein